jgi:hypothetical protein
MARIDIKSAGATLSDGVLQLENGVAMDATLRNVADQNNTTSPLKLSTNLVQTTSTLKITTDNNPYIDAEDGSINNRFTVGRDSSSQQVNVDFASNPTGSTTTVGAIRTYQDGVNLSEVVKFREDGQVTFSERVNVEADSLVTTQSSSVIAATTTNANLVIAPNGTGALVASIPDGTATGGNARGNGAVDLQLARTLNTQVGTGLYSFTTGYRNTNKHNYGAAIGYNNTLNGSNDNGYAIGNTNTVSSSVGDVYLFGANNTGSNYYTFAIGSSNISSANGSYSFGSNNQTSASGISLGFYNQTKGSYAQARGVSALAYLYGQDAYSSGSVNGAISNSGYSQSSNLVPYRQAVLTTGATTILSLDGTGVTNLIIPYTDGFSNNRAWNVQVNWVALVTAITGTATGVTVGDTKTSTDLLAVARRAGVTTVSAHTSAGTQVIETIAGSLTAANIAYTAGASQEMAITFTGPTFAGGGSVTMRVVARVQLTEVAY